MNIPNFSIQLTTAFGGPVKVNCPVLFVQIVLPTAVALFVHLTSNKKDISEQTTLKTESKIQNLINSKTIKHTEFFKKTDMSITHKSFPSTNFKSNK